MHVHGKRRSGLMVAIMMAGLGSAAQACSGDGGPAPLDMPLGSSCFDNSDCASRHCAGGTQNPASYGVCTHPCKTDADCADGKKSDDRTVDILACGIARDGTRACVPRCPAMAPSRFQCENGVSVACERARAPNCMFCGCPLDKRCTADGCSDRLDAGGSCESDDACVSGHCVLPAGKCGVKVGQPCTAENCEFCYTSGSWSFCAYRSCGSDCTLTNGACIPDALAGGGSLCKPFCADNHHTVDALPQTGCPGMCKSVRVDAEVRYYCDCAKCELAR